jgi:hypothetical protein
MKITKQGTPQPKPEYDPNDIVSFSCFRCKTEFECTVEECDTIEAREVGGAVLDTAFGYPCPNCPTSLSSKKIRKQ